MASSEQYHHQFPAFASTSYSQLSLRQPIILPSDRYHLHFPKPRQFRTAVTSDNSASAAAISSVVAATPTFDNFVSSSAAAGPASFSSVVAATPTFDNFVSSAAATPTFKNSVSTGGGPASFSLTAAAAVRAQEQKWKGYVLTYTFDSSFPNCDKAKRAIQRALQEWEEMSIFSFFLSYDGRRANIIFGMHGDYTRDCIPFDNDVLAHASPPPYGRVHFNSDLNWDCTLDGPPKGSRSFDLQSVALHEIGHSLGLDHIADPKAVMYETIGHEEIKRCLTKADIEQLEALYSNLYSLLD